MKWLQDFLIRDWIVKKYLREWINKEELEINNELKNIIASKESENELTIFSVLRSNTNSDEA
jgi:hypothetical protein